MRPARWALAAVRRPLVGVVKPDVEVEPEPEPGWPSEKNESIEYVDEWLAALDLLTVEDDSSPPV